MPKILTKLSLLRVLKEIQKNASVYEKINIINRNTDIFIILIVNILYKRKVCLIIIILSKVFRDGNVFSTTKY